MRQIGLTTNSGKTDIAVGERLSEGLARLETTPVLLIDENVLRRHGDHFNKFQCISVPSGERYKTLGTVENIYRELVRLEADRSSLIVGIGGGLATDVAGFSARRIAGAPAVSSLPESSAASDARGKCGADPAPAE